jgi:Uma2 family endonuclease
MRTASTTSMTPEQYLEFEAAASVRHEYVNGEVFAMVGETAGHALICGRLFRKLAERLDGSGCQVYMEQLKVRIEAANSYYYPDLVVTCEPFQRKAVTLTAPVMIVEVLSRSTQNVDRREKLLNYRMLPSLREYLLVSQNRILVEYHRLNADGIWEPKKLGAGDILILESLPGGPLRIPVHELYKEFDLPPSVAESGEEYDCDYDGDY